MSPPATSPRRILAVAVLVAALVTGLAAPASAAGMRGRMLRLINDVRVAHGEHTLHLNLTVSHMARHHSRRMSERDTLFHTPHLDRKLADLHWTVLGENIAFAGTVHEIFHLWMHSAEHRANILKAAYRHVGIGLYRGRGSIWATTDFWG